MADDDVDREAPTPKTTGSFAVFHADAERLEKRFAKIVETMRFRNKNEITRDLETTSLAGKYAKECGELALRFAAWPTLHPETVALERPILVNRLLDLNRQCEEISIKVGMPPERK